MSKLIHRKADREAGFSLIEVLFALAILAGVMLSIASLIYIASRSVTSGKSNSESLATARAILEELKEFGFHQTYTLLGHDGSQPAFVLDTAEVDAGTLAPDVEAIVGPWHTGLKDSLKTSRIEIRFASIVETGIPPNLEDSDSIVIEVTVYWTEFLRNRSVRLCTVRT